MKMIDCLKPCEDLISYRRQTIKKTLSNHYLALQLCYIFLSMFAYVVETEGSKVSLVFAKPRPLVRYQVNFLIAFISSAGAISKMIREFCFT